MPNLPPPIIDLMKPFARCFRAATMWPVAVEFLRHLIAAVPYKIRSILSDNGIQFADRKQDRYAFKLLFDRICTQHSMGLSQADLLRLWLKPRG
jgi:hypothetical protein